MPKSSVYLLGIFLLAWLVTACQAPEKQSRSGKLRIVTTTGMLADGLRHIAGPEAEVIALMGPGVDPHLYKASQTDLATLQSADVIVFNGLHLEGKMAETLHKLGSSRPVIAAGEGIAPQNLQVMDPSGPVYDPHIWFDVRLWKEALAHVTQELARIDSNRASAYRKNFLVYADSLDTLNTWVRTQIAQIPAEKRVLITAHDAFGYFGRAYGIEVRGLQGISTLSEYGLRDVADLVNFIVQRKIPALFTESSVSPKSIEAVLEGCRAQGHAVNLGGTLYSDAMGSAQSPEGNYLGMVRYNVRTMVKALSSAQP